MEAIKVWEQDGNRSVGIYKDCAKFLAMTYSKSKTFKTRKGAKNFMEKNGYSMIDKELIDKCEEAGKKDYLEGTSVPHLSKRLNVLTENLKAVRESIPYLKAWRAGWQYQNDLECERILTES